MKLKLFLGVLAVCMAATSAQAVTLAWNIQTTYSSLSGYDTLYLVASTSSDSTSSSYWTNWSSSSTTDAVTTIKSGTTISYTNATVDNADNTTVTFIRGLTLTTGSYYYLVFASSTDSNMYTVVGGTTYSGTTYSTTNADNTNNLGFIADDDSVNGLPTTWGDYYYDAGVVHVSTPEPTVFALLALGVAGLALRRKVA